MNERIRLGGEDLPSGTTNNNYRSRASAQPSDRTPCLGNHDKARAHRLRMIGVTGLELKKRTLVAGVQASTGVGPTES